MHIIITVILIAATCVPNVRMAKTTFLDCVKPYPDQYWVARHYGVPQRIVDKSSSHTQETDWIYVKVNGWEDRYGFGPNGRLRSQPKPKPTPQPSPRKLISPTR